jgi:hypothetical protein
MLDLVPFPAAQNAPTNLAGVHALVSDEGLGVVLELVGVAEGDRERVGEVGALAPAKHHYHYCFFTYSMTRSWVLPPNL